jgi:CheY-like chemotaxis protein
LQLAAPSVQTPDHPLDLVGLRILVADESPNVRRIIRKALEHWGAHTVEVDALPDLLRELRSTAYNAVVIDHSVIEDTDVREFQSVLSERTVPPRVIRLASFTNISSTQDQNIQWFDAEITKPVRLSQLHRALTGDTAADPSQTTGHPAPLPTLAADLHVLVVEDQSLNRDVAEGMLKALGLRVDTAHDGRHALEMLARTNYDVVLMDCRMPVMDGFAATAELRLREGEGRHTPVIALTADTTNAAREACFAAGMDDYLGKPFSRSTLRAALARWVPARTEQHTGSELSRKRGL